MPIRERERERESNNSRGIPIGNLTSQIFANIYLNELDRFIKHNLKIKYYLRYGDDFIILANNLVDLEEIRHKVKEFLSDNPRLEINSHSDIIIPANQGIKFLGAVIFPWSLRLSRRNQKRLKRQINLSNLSSYSGLTRQFESKKLSEINYLTLQLLNNL